MHLSRGLGDYVIEWAHALAPVVDLRLVLAAKDEWMAEHLPGNVDVIRSGAPAVRSPANLVAMARLVRTLRKLRPAITHCQSGLVWEQALIPATRATRILTVHDVTVHPSKSLLPGTPQWLLDAPTRFAHGLIVHGTAMRAAAQRRFGTSVPVAIIDHPAIRRYGVGQPRPGPGRRVLFFGRLDEYKGLEHLAGAVPLVREQLSDVEFIVAGAADKAGYYDQLFAGLGVDLRLRHQTAEEVGELFRWADLLVMPYVEASQSGVLHLALSFALPVVATPVGSVFDMVSHGESAWQVPPKDPRALATGILRVLTDSSVREALTAGVCRLRDTRLSPPRIAADTVRFYEEVMMLRASSHGPG